MYSKLLALLLSTLILACPVNCMQESVDGTEPTMKSCCSHCSSKSENGPLAPEQSSSECCQCFCTGAILEDSSQIDLTLKHLVLEAISLHDTQFQLISLSQQYSKVLPDSDRYSGREIRCLQMSFQC